VIAARHVFNHLQIYDSRERLIVGCADALLRGYAAASRRLSSRPTGASPRQILLLRLERIGDLLMTLGPIEAVRARAPDARIHLVVGSWNASLARLVPGIDSHETLDVPWLARQDAGASTGALVRRARAWRGRGFDLALNFEPDIRSNLLLALCGAPRRVGFSSGGGGAFLTHALSYNPTAHTAVNALRLVDAALPVAAGTTEPRNRYPRLPVPREARQAASALLGNAGASHLLVGLHASGGRQIKQWHMDRFSQVATRLARDFAATIVLTGTPEDRPFVDRIASLLPADVRMRDVASSMDLPVFAGLLEQFSLFITCDSGPMHLAAALGTPVVALFGPSDPDRYGPLTDRVRVVTADLWCRPCNRVRRPPARCVGHVPDCLDGIDVEAVCRAANELLKGEHRPTST
jgi:lipopolysaccharide heptosyltransferase II